MARQILRAITGTLTLLPNPCTTDPCVPGMALAIVVSDGVQYFLTKNGRFLQGLAEGRPMPQPGDKVVASGTTQDKQDTAGNPFIVIEFTNLRQANSDPGYAVVNS